MPTICSTCGAVDHRDAGDHRTRAARSRTSGCRPATPGTTSGRRPGPSARTRRTSPSHQDRRDHHVRQGRRHPPEVQVRAEHRLPRQDPTGDGRLLGQGRLVRPSTRTMASPRTSMSTRPTAWTNLAFTNSALRVVIGHPVGTYRGAPVLPSVRRSHSRVGHTGRHAGRQRRDICRRSPAKRRRFSTAAAKCGIPPGRFSQW